MKTVMAFLAEEWVIGYSVFTAIVIIGYLVYSIGLVRKCRAVGYDVGVSAMLPVWNIIVWFKKCLFVRKLRKLKKQEEEALINEEVDLGL